MVEFGRFRVDRVLGAGGMGIVLGGMDQETGDPVAVKLIARSSDQKLVHRMHREARAMASLNHPNVVHIVDYGVATQKEAVAVTEMIGETVAAGGPFIAMELADKTLNPVADVPNWPRARRLLSEMLGGLAHAHSQGLVHRDLKPGNVLLRRAGHHETACLTDFGVVFGVDEAPPRRDAVVGTVRYMPPEQFGDWRDIGPWSDLYALGCIAFHMVHGRPAWTGTALQVVSAKRDGEVPPLSSVRMHVPRGLEAWLSRLLQPRPHDRFTSCAAALSALSGLGEAEESEIVGPDPVEQDDDTRLRVEEATVMVDASAQVDEPVFVASPARSPLPKSWGDARGNPRPAVTPSLFDLRPIPFVGRRSERNLLWTDLRRCVTEAIPTTVFVHGISGCGKTRLARWLTETAHECGGIPYFRAAWEPSGGGLRGLGRRILRSAGLDHVDVRRRLAAFLDEDARVEALACDVADEDVRRTDDLVKFSNERVRVRSYVDLVLAAAGGGAFTLQLDDVHRDPEAAHFIDAVTRTTSPAMIVATVRTDEPATWSIDDDGNERVRHLRLEPLAGAEHRELIGSMLRLDDRLTEEVAERTEGSPLLAMHLLGDWLHRGLLRRHGDSWKLLGEEPVMVPATVLELVGQRLDAALEGFDDGARDAALLLAELGENVSLVEWHAALSRLEIDAPREMLDRLARYGIAQPKSEPGRFLFAHSTAREALLARSEREGRAPRLSSACATILHELYQRRTRGLYARVAEHHRRAEEFEKAAGAYLRAAREGTDLGNRDWTFEMIRRRNEIRGPDIETREDAEVGLMAAVAHAIAGEVDRAKQLQERVEQGVRRAGMDEFLPEVVRSKGILARLAGENRLACSLLEEAAREFQAQGNDRKVGLALLGTVPPYRFLGQLSRALERADDSLEILRRVGDPFWIVLAKRERLTVLPPMGREHDVEEVKALYAEAKRVSATQGAAKLASDIARVYWRTGDLEGARQWHQRSHETMLESGDFNAPMELVGLALVAVGLGDLGRARNLLTMYHDTASPLVCYYNPEGPLLHLIVEHALDALDHDQADALTAEAERLLARQGVSSIRTAAVARAAADVLSTAGFQTAAERATAMLEDQLRRMALSPEELPPVLPR